MLRPNLLSQISQELIGWGPSTVASSCFSGPIGSLANRNFVALAAGTTKVNIPRAPGSTLLKSRRTLEVSGSMDQSDGLEVEQSARTRHGSTLVFTSTVQCRTIIRQSTVRCWQRQTRGSTSPVECTDTWLCATRCVSWRLALPSLRSTTLNGRRPMVGIPKRKEHLVGGVTARREIP